MKWMADDFELDCDYDVPPVSGSHGPYQSHEEAVKAIQENYMALGVAAPRLDGDFVCEPDGSPVGQVRAVANEGESLKFVFLIQMQTNQRCYVVEAIDFDSAVRKLHSLLFEEQPEVWSPDWTDLKEDIVEYGNQTCYGPFDESSFRVLPVQSAD